MRGLVAVTAGFVAAVNVLGAILLVGYGFRKAEKEGEAEGFRSGLRTLVGALESVCEVGEGVLPDGCRVDGILDGEWSSCCGRRFLAVAGECPVGMGVEELSAAFAARAAQMRVVGSAANKGRDAGEGVGPIFFRGTVRTGERWLVGFFGYDPLLGKAVAVVANPELSKDERAALKRAEQRVVSYLLVGRSALLVGQQWEGQVLSCGGERVGVPGSRAGKPVVDER